MPDSRRKNDSTQGEGEGGKGTRVCHAILSRDVINAPLHFLGTKVRK